MFTYIYIQQPLGVHSSTAGYSALYDQSRRNHSRKHVYNNAWQHHNGKLIISFIYELLKPAL